MDKRDRLVCRDSDSSYNTADLSLILLKIATTLESLLAFIGVYLLTWHYAGTRDTYMFMHAARASYAYCIPARTFAQVLALS